MGLSLHPDSATGKTSSPSNMLGITGAAVRIKGDQAQKDLTRCLTSKPLNGSR